MCIILSVIFAAITFYFFSEGDMLNASVNGFVTFVLIGLIIRNIRTTIVEKKKASSK